MRYIPSIQYNIIHWQVFEDDQQIKNFLEKIEEFTKTEDISLHMKKNMK